MLGQCVLTSKETENDDDGIEFGVFVVPHATDVDGVKADDHHKCDEDDDRQGLAGFHPNCNTIITSV